MNLFFRKLILKIALNAYINKILNQVNSLKELDTV